MATPHILIHDADPDTHAATLKRAFPSAKCTTCASYAGLPQAIATARPDVVYTVRFAGTVGFPREALFSEHGPRWIANGGAGTDHFGTWDTDKVTVTNAAGVAADMMAEYIMGGFLHFSLDVQGLQADKSNRVWQARTMVPLKGKTLLIIGLGHTGQALAARAKAFGMYVIGIRARPKPTPDVDEIGAVADLDGFILRADFIAVATPLTQSTRNLIGAAAIACMKKHAVFADVSRGGVTDQTALHAALVNGHLRGAVVDVFETEPLPAASPLWDTDRLLISPHCSSVYAGWEDASFEFFLENLERWLSGGPLKNVVDPVRGY